MYLVSWGARKWVNNPHTSDKCNFDNSKLRIENNVVDLPEGETIIEGNPYPAKDCAYYKVGVPAGRSGSGIFVVASGQLREFHTTEDYERVTRKRAADLAESAALPANVPYGPQLVRAGLVQDETTKTVYLRSHYDI